METPLDENSIEFRLSEGLSRLATVLGADDRARAKALGLTATQLSVIELLAGRPEGVGVGEIARHLAVTQPSATDSIIALERKGLVEKVSPVGDRRASIVRLTVEGRQSTSAGFAVAGALTNAVSQLPEARKEALLVTVITLIRTLQEAGAIPVQRMCPTCQYFRPHHHADPRQPHHCALVDAAFGDPELRVDCRDHRSPDPAQQAATWRAFTKG